MRDVQDFFLGLDVSLGPARIGFCLLLSFLLSQVIAAAYTWTYQGLSFSRGFVHSLMLGSLVTTIAMLAVGNSLAVSFGLVGALSVVRFRSNLKDPRDMMFVFASLAVGIAVGVQIFTVAVLATLAYLLLACHLAWSSVGSRRQFSGLLRFQVASEPGADERVKGVLGRFCSNFVLINLRQAMQGQRVEHAYQVRLKDSAFEPRLVEALSTVPDLRGLTYISQDENLEL